MARSNAARKPRGEVVELFGHHYFDPFEVYANAFPKMVDDARAARLEESGEDRNWRKFLVGCVVLATDVAVTKAGFYKGHNTKPNADSAAVCAETRAIRQAEKDGLTVIVGAVITGMPQLDEASKIHAPTLHCCINCRKHRLGEKTLDEAVITTVLPNKDAFEIMTAKSMIRVHERAAEGEEVWDPQLWHDTGFRRWERSKSNYRSIIPDGTDTMANSETRLAASKAAMTAITGYSLFSA